jgi:hypothetical protein
MRIVKVMFLAALLVCKAFSLGQTKSPNKQKSPCDQEMNFCWYGPYDDGSDEVDVWGDRWVTQDEREKSLEISTAIRCVKRMRVCVYASSQLVFGDRRITKIDLLPITHWDDQQITADGENASREPCDRDSYLINRGDRSVTLISSPGLKGDAPVCTNVLGKPKTVVYALKRN